MGKKWYTPVPNQLIEDCSLSHTAKRVAVALMLENRRQNGKIRISYGDLAKRSGCSVSTTQKAVQELIVHGYVTYERHFYYSVTQGKYVRSKNTYRMAKISGSYTLIPRTALRRRGKNGGAHAVFSVLLYLYRCAGRVGRAFPSLRRMADDMKGCGASKASVCRALAMLRMEGAFIRLECRRMRGDLSCNSYHMTDMVIAGKHPTNADIAICPENKENSKHYGGLKLGNLPENNKITGDYILREKKYGVAEFGNLHNFDEYFSWMKEFYFDGIGVKVSANGELNLTS